MKTLLSVALAAVFGIAMVGCGPKGQQPPASSPPPASAPATAPGAPPAN